MESELIKPPGERLISIDALRGFTMFFIIGGENIFTSFYQVWPNSITETLAKNMEHAEWEGFYIYDQIFPIFLFLVGLLIPMVILRNKEKGKTKKRYTFISANERLSSFYLDWLTMVCFVLTGRQCAGRVYLAVLEFVIFLQACWCCIQIGVFRFM